MKHSIGKKDTNPNFEINSIGTYVTKQAIWEDINTPFMKRVIQERRTIKNILKQIKMLDTSCHRQRKFHTHISSI